jgi:glucose-6-phosphate isomerase
VSSILDQSRLLARFDPAKGTCGDAPVTKRYLSDLRGCFCDAAAFDRALSEGDRLIYAVASVESPTGDGDLHYGLGTIYPGRIGEEYFLTRGHLHKWRAAAEVYIGLAGQGAMLLQDESGSESRMLPLQANTIVYVPGYTAHRTMNTGDAPLVYLGVYPARAGHDYTLTAQCNFRSIVVERDGRACMLRRSHS